MDKKERLLAESVRTRNVNQAERRVRENKKYKRDTILHSAKIITVWPRGDRS